VNSTREVRESRIVKSYPNRSGPACERLLLAHPIVSPEIESDPIPKGADLQQGFFARSG